MKKCIAIALALAMALMLLAGCGGGTAAPAAGSSDSGTGAQSSGAEAPQSAPVTNASDGSSFASGSFGDSETVFDNLGHMELVVGSINDVGSMYQGGAMTTGRKSMHVLVYEPLFWQDPETFELHPILGKSYESLGNGRYSIEIFDYITDSAGNHMTAEDVVYSIDLYIRDGQNSSNYATLTDYHATGDYTLELTFDPEVKGQFEAFVSYLYCVTRAAWESSPDEMTERPVSTGRYDLVYEESILGSTYVFAKRDGYWQTDERYICDRNRGTLDKVTIKVIPESSTLAIALQNGEVDFVADISAADRQNFMDANGNVLPGFMMISGANNAFVHLTFNAGTESPCQDLKLRRAICYAIDSAACAFNAHGAFGEACKSAANPNLGDYDRSLMDNEDYFAYNPELARQLVQESGYAGQKLKVLVQPNPSVKACAPLVQQYCAEAGIDMELLNYDMPQFKKLEADESGTAFDIMLHGLTATDDYVFRSLVELDNRTTDSGNNDCYVSDPELQALYEASASVETNSPETVKALLDYVEENCYVYGLYYSAKIFYGTDAITYAVSGIPEDAIYDTFVIER